MIRSQANADQQDRTAIMMPIAVRAISAPGMVNVRKKAKINARKKDNPVVGQTSAAPVWYVVQCPVMKMKNALARHLRILTVLVRGVRV